MNRLKELRLKRGLSQQELAKKVGISNQSISSYEKGVRKPKIEAWEKIADYFGVSIAYLQGRYDHLTKKEALRVIHEVMTVCGISKEELKERL